MIDVAGLTKHFGATTAVQDLTFTVQPGLVTGFLGPNGAGKSTTMRLMLGLDRPTAGSATINGRRYADHRAPLHEVGALLDAKAVHPGRSARAHLRALAATHGISQARVDTVIGLTGLDSVAGKRVGGFSLGMGQRLGIAAALLGDPAVVILDEPVNGLDPDGVLWVRGLAKHLASEGRTVFLSSHLMSEMAQTADRIVIVGKGRLLVDEPMAALLARSGSSVVVAGPALDPLTEAVARGGGRVQQVAPDRFEITGPDAAWIGEFAAEYRLVLHELTPRSASLEEAYLAMTRDETEYVSGGAR
ncbi:MULTISPECIES: ABC transporter ATP-binding protein [unclassified Curtobacterium]|uniref:ABC transporter ATP-binding protein n=1 Tax=unclassified Curtobacterium TaxID=257496 RepID=UPI000DAA86BC|nr:MULTISPECIES: ATP-binding cassette domain-containing protein [unclassified Curtobacterium]PZE23114.1 ABC transporter ATP-binding protein [Curtobacterium sp. MCBD17_028]PZE77665.1 ABC transporter ATP-binding protein [Curtobacterium sp. MCBD17_019]WIB63769.1 ATP-binding cassette domain-containing protein [Curtobacterium sp. MCBD17_040]